MGRLTKENDEIIRIKNVCRMLGKLSTDLMPIDAKASYLFFLARYALALGRNHEYGSRQRRNATRKAWRFIKQARTIRTLDSTSNSL